MPGKEKVRYVGLPSTNIKVGMDQYTQSQERFYKTPEGTNGWGSQYPCTFAMQEATAGSATTKEASTESTNRRCPPEGRGCRRIAPVGEEPAIGLLKNRTDREVGQLRRERARAALLGGCLLSRTGSTLFRARKTPIRIQLKICDRERG